MRLPRIEPECLNSDSLAVVVNRYNLSILDLTNKETHSARKNDFSVGNVRQICYNRITQVGIGK